MGECCLTTEMSSAHETLKSQPDADGASAQSLCYPADARSDSACAMSRVWAMPSHSTFDVPPIRALVKKYLSQSKVSVDPFARNKRWATYTNDLNAEMAAEFHMDALDFLSMLKNKGIQADLLIFDPPYSFHQMKEVYAGIGRQVTARESTNFYGDVRNALDGIAAPDAIALSFGWNSIGMGKVRGYALQEILLVCHGRAHNDTICTVERKIVSAQMPLIGEAG